MSKNNPNPPNTIDAARDAINILLGVAEVKRVICIDDAYDKSITLEKVIGLCNGMNNARLSGISELKGIDFDAPSEIWESELKDIWEGSLNETIKQKICRDIRILRKEIST